MRNSFILDHSTTVEWKDKSMHLSIKIDWRVFAPMLVAIAGGCWGVIGLFSTYLSSTGLRPEQITVVRCVIAAGAIGLFLLVRKRSAFVIRLKDIWMFLGTGILSIAFFNVCYFACIDLCGLSFAAILLYTAPCFVVLLSAVFFKEKLTRQRGSALVLAFVGCLLVVGVGSGESSLSGFGILVGLASGIGYALYSIFARVALKRYEAPTVMFYTFLSASLTLIPFSEPQAIVALASDSSAALLVMIALALVSTVTPFACYTVGLAHMETGKASIMAFIEPMVSLLIGISVFGDVLTFTNGLGIVAILIAVALLNMPEEKIFHLNKAFRNRSS